MLGGGSADINVRSASKINHTKMSKYINAKKGDIFMGESFLPLAFETSGSYLPATADFLSKIAEAGMINIRRCRVDLKSIKERVALAIFKGNAMIMRQGLSYLSRSVSNDVPFPCITSSLSREGHDGVRVI